MTRYAAFLRAINVGGRNRLPMKELTAMFEAAGASTVRSYVQSGNVVFDAPEKVAAGLATRITQNVRERFGHAPVVVLRTKDEIAAIEQRNPFVGRGADYARMQVMFLADAPAAERAATLDPDRSPGEEYVLLGRELYLYQPAGIAHSRLTNAYFDAKLKTTTTGRNWRTVLAIAEMMDTTPRKT